MTKKKLLEEIRRSVADLIASEGCGCCQDYSKHGRAKETLALLLAVPMYRDKSGWDFERFETKEKGLV